MLNRVVITGRLTRDPDLRYTSNGIAVANFTIASNRPFKNQDGEQEADFINCVVWRKAAENLANYMKKGSMIGIDGRLQSRSYEDNNGKMVYVTEVLAENIQFLESRGSSQQNQGAGSPYDYQSGPSSVQARTKTDQTQQQSNNSFQNDTSSIDITDDDLPF